MLPLIILIMFNFFCLASTMDGCGLPFSQRIFQSVFCLVQLIIRFLRTKFFKWQYSCINSSFSGYALIIFFPGFDILKRWMFSSFQTFVLFHCRLVVFNQLMVFGIMYWKWKDIDKTLKLLLLFMYSYESEHSISKFVLRFLGSWLERVVSKQVNHRRWWCDVWPTSKQVCFCVQTHAPPWIVGNFSLLRKRFDGFLTLHFLLSLLLIWNIR